jgi:hypothetical protein
MFRDVDQITRAMSAGDHLIEQEVASEIAVAPGGALRALTTVHQWQAHWCGRVGSFSTMGCEHRPQLRTEFLSLWLPIQFTAKHASSLSACH